MKTIQRLVGTLLCSEDVTEVTIKKVEDSNVKIFYGENYFGEYSFDYKNSIHDLLREHTIFNKIIQDLTIGLFKPYGSDKVEMVISREDFGGLHTISPTLFGSFSETHIPEEQGIYAPFEPGVNLTQMMSKPIEFNDFFNSYFKK